ncbi:iron-containing alcohol dehydrogenase [Bradyrhizobium prioriisuperbiae]|uniref:iron-containing alcohol dehydrogenase n=1 Tax=Bradyrhizobium prioriisuperbiae TaxID=2854389 RepID=UPI0028ED2A29|nr:iron-containing alcohol dehydrogenase [Bradyrhizobium prioritasuperba]
MLSGIHRFPLQERVIFGKAAQHALVDEARRLGCSRLFLVCSPSLRRSTFLSGIVDALGSRFAGAYFDMRPHSPRESVIGAARAARAASADLLVAIGGGSVIDACKLTQRVMWLALDCEEDLDRLRKGITPEGSTDVLNDSVPTTRSIAVPTTFSGAEFTSFAGVTESSSGVKEVFDHPLQIPRSVILDPEATLGVPNWVLMSTGVRAVDHCVETFCSPESTPYADAMAIQAFRTLLRTLPKLQADPLNLQFRLDAQLGMWLSILGPAAGVPVGASHGIGRVLGGAFGVPHGRTSCMLLASVLRWNSKVNAERQAELCALIGKPDHGLAEVVEDLVTSLGEPIRLRQADIEESKLRNLAERTVASGFLENNPRSVHGADDVMEILRLSW